MSNQPNLEEEDFDWHDYFEEQLTFPFKATVSHYKEGNYAGEEVKVHAIDEFDDHYGYIAKCKIGRKTIFITLIDLDIMEGENQAILDAVKLWVDSWLQQ